MLGIAATIPVHKLGNLYGFLAPMLPCFSACGCCRTYHALDDPSRSPASPGPYCLALLLPWLALTQATGIEG